MPTQTTTLNPSHGNTNDAEENRRVLDLLNDQSIAAVRFWGERDEVATANEYIADYFLPSPIASAEQDPVGAESQVDIRTAGATQIRNMVQVIAKQAPFKKTSQNRLVGNIGSVEFQGDQLMRNGYRIINQRMLGNYGSVAATTTTDGNKCGSPVTFLGNTSSNTLADNDSIASVASDANTVLTDSGGYDTTTRLSDAIDDATTVQGTVGIDHVLSAIERIHDNTLGHSGSSDEDTGDRPMFVVFIPSHLLVGFTKNAAAGGNLTSLNRFNTRIGGSPMQITATFKQIETPYGMVVIMSHPSKEYAGEGTNNKMVIVATNDATGVVYNERLTVEELPIRTTERVVSLNGAYTFHPPKQELMTAIIGVKQTR